jgi:GT2 family glycosyltransferase/glycosyltransferase involved in cell wall biosynthesis
MGHVAVVIPIYNGIEYVSDCIQSVILSLPHNNNSVEIVLVNDCSTDPKIFTLLTHLQAVYDNINVFEMTQNMGFVRSVNAGILASAQLDVIMLNSDTIVHGNWIDRLYNVAYSSLDVGTVTPLTNDGTICSFPKWLYGSPVVPDDIAILDNMFNTYNHPPVQIPTCVGFCTYIKRQVFTEVGLFNFHKFGRGYGEENDFSLRCIRHGYTNMCATNTYVGHVGSGSFGDEKNKLSANAQDVLSELYPKYNTIIETFCRSYPFENLFVNMKNKIINTPELSDCVKSVVTVLPVVPKVLKKIKQQYTHSILHVLHGWGGGTEKHVKEMCMLTETQNLANCLILKPSGGFTNSAHGDVVVCDYENNIKQEFNIYTQTHEMVEFLKSMNIMFVHYHHVINLDPSLLKIHEQLKVKYYVTLHDYYLGCPRVNMLAFNNTYCGIPQDTNTCNKCIKELGRLGELPEFNSIEEWRATSEIFLSGATTVFAPSIDMITKFNKLIPGISISLRQHPEPFLQTEDLRRKYTPRTDRITDVLIVGSIGVHKGSRVLLDIVKAAHDRRLPIKFTIIGITDIDSEMASYPNVNITGTYDSKNIKQLIKDANCHIAFFPAIWPETYSFTLSEIMASNIPCVGFSDISGAIQTRIFEHSAGVCIPNDNNSLNTARRLVTLGQTLSNINIRYSPIKYDNILINYYGIKNGIG